MASSFPFLLRVAAGLVSDTVDVVRRIPEELPTLGVTLVGKAAKLSFELNQQLTALAVRGDQALSALSGSEPPPERTAWSTIDDEDEVAANDPQAAARWDSVADAEADHPETAFGSADEPARFNGGGFADSAGDVVHDTAVVHDTVVHDTEHTIAETGIPGYQHLSLAQLRGKLRSLTADQIGAALAFEQTHQSRPAFLTLLTNRQSSLARG